MKSKQKTWIGLITGWAISLGGAQLQAQTGSAGSTVAVAGKLAAVKGEEVTIETKAGPVAVQLGDKTMIRGEVPIKFSDITSGMYVGATAEKQPDGTFRASRLHVFSEDQRGTGEGHRPLSSAPQSGLTMTNANVRTGIGVFFFLVALFFVYRSFYGMRIPEESASKA